MIHGEENGRKIGLPDKLFGVSSLAKARAAEIGKENVINSTIGVLLDDNGKLAVLDSVMEVYRRLNPEDVAAYAPILGKPEYLEAVKKAVFLDAMPENTYLAACYTPGGTGAIRNAISGYTKFGEKILTSDWHWSPYNTIAEEIGRKVTTYTLFDDDKFNCKDFAIKLTALAKEQDDVLIIVNTPAHNPTGYTFTEEDWDKLLGELQDEKYANNKITLLVDIAYLDFSGNEKEYRRFLKKLEGLKENILTLIAFSASKGYTMYGMRCGALMCMAQTEEMAKEFQDIMKVCCRGSWSNGNGAAMSIIAEILKDDKLYGRVKEEREEYLKMLRDRGQVFMAEAEAVGLKPCPYDSGFFITIPCEDADEVGKRLQKDDVFCVAIGPGIRVSVASLTKDECKRIPALIKKAIG